MHCKRKNYIEYRNKIRNFNKSYYNNGKLFDNNVGEHNSRKVSNLFLNSKDMIPIVLILIRTSVIIIPRIRIFKKTKV